MRSAYRPIRCVALAALALAAVTLSACSREEGPEPALTAFAQGWQSGQLDKVNFVTPEGQPVPPATVAEELKKYSGDLAKNPPAVRVSGKPKVTKDLATGELAVSWPVTKDVKWEYTVPTRQTRNKEGKWGVVWSPAAVHQQLTSSDTLRVRRTEAARGTIQDGAGTALVEPRPVVVIGVSPEKIKDLPALTAALDAAFKSIKQSVDLADLPARVKAAQPNAFIELITLRRPLYDQIRNQVRDLEGTVFREENLQLPPTREFARSTLGSVGPVTKEIMDKNPGKYVEADQVGLSGIQRKYDDVLRGTPGLDVVLARADGSGKTTDTPLLQSPPKAGTAVKTTLNVDVQNAADRALASQPKRSALVAVRVSDGAVLAVANGPDGGGVNYALTAQVPPGSTFKMVAALGLLDAGAVSLDGVVACPQTFTVDGATFKNANNFALGNVPFRVDFAKSCNTAFASLAPKLGPNGLADTGRAIGIGGTWDIGVEAFTGKVSTGGSGPERAAAAFGQGTTVVSPIAMAAATAAVAKGSWQPPKLVLEPAPAANGGQAATPLKESSVTALRTMMREVVSGGTSATLASVPGGPVHAKTGTAEFDSADPSKTHAWVVGWQGDIAFAVFVENGGASGAAATPLAKAFLTALPR